MGKWYAGKIKYVMMEWTRQMNEFRRIFLKESNTAFLELFSFVMVLVYAIAFFIHFSRYSTFIIFNIL